MTLAAPIRRGATMLLPAGRSLTGRDIEVLQARFPHARVRVASPGLDDVVPFEDDRRDREHAEAALEKVAACLGQVMQGQRNPRRRDSNYTATERSVSNIIAYMVSNPVGKVLPKVAFEPESYLAEHMSQVFYLAMRLGTAAMPYVVTERQRQTHARDLSHVLAQSLLPLGLGALYMDLAMADLAYLEERTDDALSEADWQRIRRHPDAAADQLPARFPPAARMVVRTHHRNFDGTGYPGAASGDADFDPQKLHVFTRIIRICDAFDAAITPRPYRPARSAIRALWEMTAGPEAGKYDPALVRVLCSIVQPFPVGARLTLTDGSVAVVTGPTPDPFAPKVVIAYDPHGNLLPRDRLAAPLVLDDHLNLRIASADGEDLGYLYDQASRGISHSTAC